jgi:hypothetical protein
MDVGVGQFISNYAMILNPGVGAIPWGGHQPERVSFMPAAGAGEAAVGGLAGTLLGRD